MSSASSDPGPRPPTSSLTQPVHGRGRSAAVPVGSLALGLVSLLGCSWIPVVNIGALLFAPLAVLLGWFGIRRQKAEHRIMSWFGIVTGGLAIVVSIGMLAVFMTSESGASS